MCFADASVFSRCGNFAVCCFDKSREIRGDSWKKCLGIHFFDFFKKNPTQQMIIHIYTTVNFWVCFILARTLMNLVCTFSANCRLTTGHHGGPGSLILVRWSLIWRDLISACGNVCMGPSCPFVSQVHSGFHEGGLFWFPIVEQWIVWLPFPQINRI